MSSTIIVHRLDERQRERFAAHLLALEPEDVRLRFGYSLGPEAIARYVEGVDLGTDAVFAVLDDDLAVLGAAHLAFADAGAELGLSVLARCRGQGVGTALFVRAQMHARNRFVSRLFMHCLAENAAMMRIARRAGMDIAVGAGDAEAFARLAAPTPASVTDEFLGQRVALLDYGMKVQLSTLARAGDAAIAAIRSTSGDQAPIRSPGDSVPTDLALG